MYPPLLSSKSWRARTSRRDTARKWIWNVTHTTLRGTPHTPTQPAMTPSSHCRPGMQKHRLPQGVATLFLRGRRRTRGTRTHSHTGPSGTGHNSASQESERTNQARTPSKEPVCPDRRLSGSHWRRCRWTPMDKTDIPTRNPGMCQLDNQTCSANSREHFDHVPSIARIEHAARAPSRSQAPCGGSAGTRMCAAGGQLRCLRISRGAYSRPRVADERPVGRNLEEGTPSRLC